MKPAQTLCFWQASCLIPLATNSYTFESATETRFGGGGGWRGGEGGPGPRREAGWEARNSVINDPATHWPGPFRVLVPGVNLTFGFLYKSHHEERPTHRMNQATKSPLRARKEMPHWEARWTANVPFPLQMSSGTGPPPVGLPAPTPHSQAKPNQPTHLKTKHVSFCLPPPCLQTRLQVLDRWPYLLSNLWIHLSWN